MSKLPPVPISARSSGLLLGLVALLLLFCLAAPVAAQEETAGEERASDPAEGTGFGEDVDFGAFDDLLQQDEEVRSDPGTYTYDPGARRDPFRSLLERSAADDEIVSERPEGVPGLLVDEITIEGIYMLPEGPVAQIISSSLDTSYLIRPGDQLWDGEVVSITLDEVVFKQDADDPTSLKPFREVVKKLHPET